MAALPKPWTCDTCHEEQTDETWCHTCDRARFATLAIQIAEHVLEHIADGVTEPLAILKLMQARPCYAPRRDGGPYRVTFTLQQITSQIRMLTRDTTRLARDLLKADAARMALNVARNGDTKDHLAALKGIQVLGEVVEHKGSIVTTHIVELSDGPPPKREA